MAVPPPVPKDDRPFTMTTLRRVALWGVSAALSMVLVVLVQASDEGHQRMALLLGGETATQVARAPEPPPRDPEAERELRRQAENLRLLAADRERMAERLAAIERNVEDITGSIRQPRPAPERPALPYWLTPPTILAPPTTEATVASRAAPKDLSADSAPAETGTVRTEFGIDLGAAANFDELRSLWNTVKLSHPAVIEPLRPVIGVREDKERIELRLIAGPLANAGAAARLCATLSASGKPCQPAVFDGQRLALH